MKKLLILIGVTVAMALTWFAYAKKNFFPENKRQAWDEVTLKLDEEGETNSEFTDDEKNILKELKTLMESYSSKSAFYLSGTIELTDPSDSLQLNASSHFEFLKRDKVIYYKNEDQESLNTEKYYAVADHQAKKIIVSLPKEARDITPVPFSALIKSFKNDGYSIEKSVNGNKAVIKLVCENNITCKEIRVEYDVAARKPFLFYYRFTDFDYPDDKTRDKTMSIHINDWENDSKEKSYRIPALIDINEGAISSAKGFEDYEIMNQIN